MSCRVSPRAEKRSEPRQRAVVAVRLRHGLSWTDACILDVSSRGLLIQTGSPIAPGNEVEIHRGQHAVAARVVWRDSGRAGLEAKHPVSIEHIVVLGHSLALQPCVPLGERRRYSRADRGRWPARLTLVKVMRALAVAAALVAAGLRTLETAIPLSRALVTAAARAQGTVAVRAPLGPMAIIPPVRREASLSWFEPGQSIVFSERAGPRHTAPG
jgi:hypothetical protein